MGSVLALVAAFLVLRPGGSTGSGQTQTGPGSRRDAPPREVTLVMGDDTVRPSPIVLERDRPVTLTLRNEHHEMHHFLVEPLGLHVDVPGEGTRTVTFRPAHSGTWQSSCVLDHRESVTLIVR